MSDIPEEIMKEAEKTLDLMLCNCKEAGDVRQESIMDIARALISAEARGMEKQREIDAQKVEGCSANLFEPSLMLTLIAAAIRNGTEASDA